MNCEPPHSDETRPSRILPPRQQYTIPHSRIGAFLELSDYNALKKEKGIWVTKGKKTKGKGNSRKRPSVLQRRNAD
jgi:hypothetical protein